MKFKCIIFAAVIVSLTVFSNREVLSQSSTKYSLNNSDIEGQFKYVISKSSDFEDYKMVKRWILYSYKSHVTDTINMLKNNLAVSDSINSIKDTSIDSLANVIVELDNKLTNVTAEKESMSLLGIAMKKSTFYSIILGVLAVLIGALLVFVVMFKRSNIITINAKKDYDALNEEYEAHRKNSLKRHEKAVRELYDEILRYKKQLAGREKIS